MQVYFGGSRNLPPSPIVSQVVTAALAAGHSVHVGCQLGADAQVIQSCPRGSSLVVFAVMAAPGAFSALHIANAWGNGFSIVFAAGGTAAPFKARYLLRSLAAARGCSVAVFFSPGPGSLAVASRLVGQMPIFAFGEMPAAIPHTAGQWVNAHYFGFTCWQWLSAQKTLF